MSSPEESLSTEAVRLAHDIERGVTEGRAYQLAPDALQRLVAALCKSYSTRIDAGEDLLPLRDQQSATGTEVLRMASGLLKSSNIAVFELGMWQAWSR